ncbi:hypothetical protein RI367_002923 [Sorochytrium milnesiophthora]
MDHFRAALPPADYKYQTLAVQSLEGGSVRVVTFSRPDKFNALSPLAYKEWLWAFNEAALDDVVSVVMLTGIGPYYSSGNELSFPTPEDLVDIERLRELSDKQPGVRLLDDDLGELSKSDLLVRGRITRDLVKTMIHFPKLLVAAVNGPALGFAVTTLALCDIVYAAKEAWFQTPFMQLGFCAEGCSSVLFPRIMGNAKASQMLYAGRRFSAEELERLNLISEILPTAHFHKQATAAVCKLAKSLPPRAFLSTKRLVRSESAMKELDDCNDREMNTLIERMASEECAERVITFFAKKQKGTKQKL